MKSRRLSNQVGTAQKVVTPRKSLKVGRNEACPCGSGDKYKDCCFHKGTVFLEKLDRKRERQALKESGVPWYVRLLS